MRRRRRHHRRRWNYIGSHLSAHSDGIIGYVYPNNVAHIGREIAEAVRFFYVDGSESVAS